jgi:hypothetical protein
MQSINFRPSDHTLREFADFGSFILGLVAAPWLLYGGHTTAAVVLWAVAVVLRLAGWLDPKRLKWPFVVLSLITWPIGLVVSFVALAVIYFLVFTPLALFFRLIGRDALKRRRDPHAASYWEAYNPDHGRERYLRPF